MELRKASRVDSPNHLRCKIIVVGPTKGGKTALSNFLGDYVETSVEYRPTKGVRIVEFDSNDVEIDGGKVSADIEVWDCGGDGKYRECWHGMRDGTKGVVIVANPDMHTGDDILPWYDEFVLKADLHPSQVLIVLMEEGEKRTNDGAISDFRLPHKVSGCRLLACSIEHDGEGLRMEFNAFLVQVLTRVIHN